MHIKYPKIKRLGDEDNDGILLGTVHVQEKIDGANVSIWLEDGEVKCGSRTRILEGGFNGFVDYVKAHEGINKLLAQNPLWRLYGEWLVRHTVHYNETAYKQFYLFDIFDMPDEFVASESEEEQEAERCIVRQGRWLALENVYSAAESFGILTPKLFATLENPSPDEVEKFAGESDLGAKGEGVVLRNPDFINKWGDRNLAKVVTQEFKEDSAIVFGGNNKHSETYFEMKMVNQCMTIARIKKIMSKLQSENEKRLGAEQTGRIIQTAYHDMFEEEMWNFVKKHSPIDFRNLQKLACRKAARIYHDILNGHESVAYNPIQQ